MTGLWLSLGLLILLLGSACKPGVPVVDVGSKPQGVRGTLTGTVRGPEGMSLGGRTVEFFNTATGEKFTTRNQHDRRFHHPVACREIPG